MLYVVMPFLAGPMLREWLEERRTTSCRVSEGEAAGLASQMLSAIHYLHRVAGALHRDVKPDNFGFTSPVVSCDPMPTIALFDLGLVWVLPAVVTETSASQLLPLRPCGTTQFVAPETWTGWSGPPSDLWGIGLILHTLLTMCMPFGLARCYDARTASLSLSLQHNTLDLGTDAWQIISLSARLFVAALLEKRPQARVTSAAALVHVWLKSPGEQIASDERTGDAMC
jgi:serine/threonine protein kinase